VNPIIITVITLTAIGLLVAAILFLVAKKFKVQEDARIDDVEALLPGANCGGCGSAGCRDFATKLVGMDDLGDAMCPVGGSETMNKVAALLGKTATVQAPKVAVVKCNGTCENRPKTSNYEGYASCKVMASLYSGDTGCSYGCLGCGDCTRVCKFDAIKMDPVTGLPVVDESKCTACGACAKACPKGVIEIRPKGPRGLKVVVLCNNKDKGAVARKACKAACIGCGKCFKACPHGAITVENNLAYIDADKCRLCAKCVDECPTGAIHKLNFPVKKTAAPAAPAAPAVPEVPVQNKKSVAELWKEITAKLASLVKFKPREVEAAPETRIEPRSAASFKTAPKAEAPAPKVEKPVEAPKPAAAKPEPKAEPVKSEPAPAVKVEAPAKPEPRPEVKIAAPVAAAKPAEVKAEEPVKPAEPKVEPVKVEPKAEEVKPEPAPAPKVEEPVKAETPVEEPKAAEPVKVAEPEVKTPEAPKAEEAVKEEPAEAPVKPAPKKRAPRKKAAPAETEVAAEQAAEEAATPAPAKPKRSRSTKAKAEKPADDRDEVIELDLFSGGDF